MKRLWLGKGELKVMFRGGDGEGYGKGQVVIGCRDKKVMVRQGEDGGYVEERG